MNKQKLYCFSHCLFDMEMEKRGWFNGEGFPMNGVAVISICSQNDDDSKHWFDNDYCPDRILNIDFDDVSPQLWWSGYSSDWKANEDYYDSAADLFLSGDIEGAGKPFNTHYTNNIGHEVYLHALDYFDAKRIVDFINNNINCDFFIHCSAGVSRSQGIVRYILDTYKDINWETKEDNPCICPNIHVVRMLKRINYLEI